MTKKKVFTLFICSMLFCVATFTISCNPPVAPESKETIEDSGTEGASQKVVIIENIVKIFMHQPNQYTYWYTATNYPGYILSFTLSSDNLIIMTNSNETSWVKYWGESSGWDCKFQELHLQNLDVVGGAGWQRKSGETTYVGATTVVQ